MHAIARHHEEFRNKEWEIRLNGSIVFCCSTASPSELTHFEIHGHIMYTYDVLDPENPLGFSKCNLKRRGRTGEQVGSPCCKSTMRH